MVESDRPDPGPFPGLVAGYCHCAAVFAADLFGLT